MGRGRTKSLCAALVVVACLCAATPSVAASNGFITGTVISGANGKPLAGILVCATYSNGHGTPIENAACAGTDAYGQYVIAAPPGTYYVTYALGNPFYIGHFHEFGPTSKFHEPAPVNVREGEAVLMPTETVYFNRGWIGGTVMGPEGGLSGIQVCAEAVTPTETGETNLSCVQSGYAGHYSIDQLEAGFYRLRFSSAYKYNGATEVPELESGNFVTKYFGGGSSASSAVPLWVSVEDSGYGLEVVLQPGATISGNVGAAGGGALQGVSVCAWGSTDYVCGETDKNGNYSIPTLAPGDYKVEFAPQRSPAPAAGTPPAGRGEFPLIEFARQYWNDKPTFESAQPVTVGEGGSVTHIDATLTKEAQPSPPAPEPVVGTAAVGRKAAVKGAKAALSVSCEGSGDCAGTIKLSTRVLTTTKGGNGKPMKRAHVVAIGHAPFSIPVGATMTVTATLNGAGKLLVQKAGAKGVRATVAGTGVRPGPVKLVASAPPASR